MESPHVPPYLNCFHPFAGLVDGRDLVVIAANLQKILDALPNTNNVTFALVKGAPRSMAVQINPFTDSFLVIAEFRLYWQRSSWWQVGSFFLLITTVFWWCPLWNNRTLVGFAQLSITDWTTFSYPPTSSLLFFHDPFPHFFTTSFDPYTA